MRTKRRKKNMQASLFELPKKEEEQKESRFQDRDYQTAAVNAVFAQWLFFRSTLIVMATGLGKTVCCVRIVERVQRGELRRSKRFLFIVHRDELVTQAYETFKDAFPNSLVEIEQGESVASDKADIVIASKDTLCKPERLKRFPNDHFGAMAVDECFPAGTLVDGKPIETIKIGDYVKSFNHDTNKIEYKKVVRLFKSKPKSMATVRLKDGRKIVCTANHPFFDASQNKYVPAYELSYNSMVLDTIAQGEKQNVIDTGNEVRALRKENDGFGLAAGGCAEGRAGVLFKGMFENIPFNSIIANDGENEPQVCFRKNEEKQSNVSTRMFGENEDDMPGSWSQTNYSRRQWHGANDLRTNDFGSVGLAVQCDSQDGEEARFGLSSSLQDRRWERNVEGCGRSGRNESLLEIAASARPQEGRTIGFVGVESVEIHEPTDSGRFEQLCSDGFVYNFEVEDNHNYFVNGVLVHNCHHCTMKNKTYSTILMYFNCPYVGITATPDRLDEEALGTIFESVAYEYDILDGIRDGWLVPVTHRLEQCEGLDYSKIKLTKTGFDPHELAEHMRKREALFALVAAAVKYSNWEGGKRQTLIFCADRKHAVLVAEMLNARHAEHGTGEAAAIHYKTKKRGPGGRREIIRRYKNREIRYLCNFGILCLDSETEILTDRGWVGKDEISYDHKVANYCHVETIHNGVVYKPGQIFFENPKFIIERDRHEGESMVSVGGRRSNIRVTEDHRMLWRSTNQSGEYKIIHAKDVAGKPGVYPVSGYAEPFDIAPVQQRELEESEIKRRISANAYNLRKNENMDFDSSIIEAKRRLEQKTSMKVSSALELSLAECWFIGFYLAEGTRTELLKGGIEYRIAQANVYPKIIEKFDSILLSMGVHFRRWEKNGVVHWSFDRGTGVDSKGGIYHLEPWLDKNGSSLFYSLDNQQWESFLHGFWAGDGDHLLESEPKPNQSLRIYNTSVQLMNWIQAVCVCRGYRASIGDYRGNVGGNVLHKPLLKMTISNRDSQMIREEVLTVEGDWKEEKVWCVTSHTGNIITRRSGKVAFTGNTEGFDDDRTCIIVNGRPLSAKARALFAQIVGRGTRPLKSILKSLATAAGPEERKAIIRASEKPGAAIVDLIGLNLKLICTMRDVLDGKRTCEKIQIPIDKKEKRSKVKERKKDPEAERKKAEYFKERAEAERLSLEMARATIVDANLTTTIVDPFNLRQRVARRESGASTRRMATEGQQKALVRCGIPKEEASQMGQGEAGRILKLCSDRRKSGLCSYPQMKILRKFGYDQNLTSTQAAEIIDRLAKNNWRKPNEDY